MLCIKYIIRFTIIKTIIQAKCRIKVYQNLSFSFELDFNDTLLIYLSNCYTFLITL